MIETSTDNLLATISRLYKHMPPRRKKQLILLVVLMLCGAVAELMTIGAILPFLALMANPARATSYPQLQGLFASLGWHDPNQILFPVTFLFAFVVIVAACVRILLFWASQKYVLRLGYDLSINVYKRTLYQPYSYHVSKNSSELIAGINKIQDVIVGVLTPLMQMVMSAVISVFILAALVSIDPVAALSAAIGFTLIYVGISYITHHILRTNSHIIARMQTGRIKTIQEGFGGIRDVLIDHAQSIYIDKFRRIDLEFRNAQLVNQFIGGAPYFAIQAFGIVLIAGLAFTLSQGSGGIAAVLPILGAMALGAQRLMPLVAQIYNGWSSVVGNQRILLDVLEMLDLPIVEEQLEKQDTTSLPFKNKIELDNVSFRYGEAGSLVLDDINLVIKKGSRVGFIGKTGSGKSTLLDLIMGLLPPTSGTLSIDSTLLEAKTTRGWQMQIAHVPQSIYLSDTSISENIAFGIQPERIDIELVRDAARRADIAEFIDTLSQGYDTFIGERGVRLSGGQRQRIGIARALYKQADVLIFDEATSALDNETEEAVMEAIRALDENLTILIIAHRLTTIEHCDKIFRFDSGRLVAEGSYKEIVSPLKKDNKVNSPRKGEGKIHVI